MQIAAGVSIGAKVKEALEAKGRCIRSQAEINEEEGRDAAWLKDNREFKNQILTKLGLLPSEICTATLREMGMKCMAGYFFNSVEYGTEPALFNKVVYELSQKLVVYHLESLPPYAIVILLKNEKLWDNVYGLDGSDALRRCFKKGRVCRIEDFI